MDCEEEEDEDGGMNSQRKEPSQVKVLRKKWAWRSDATQKAKAWRTSAHSPAEWLVRISARFWRAHWRISRSVFDHKDGVDADLVVQSYRAQAIKSYLRLVVRKNYKGILRWGCCRRLLVSQKNGWSTGQAMGAYLADDRNLPNLIVVAMSSQITSEDPVIKAEWELTCNQNKWAVNPEKLQKYHK